MTLIRRNIVWSFGGSLWVSLLGLLFVPLYIRFLGVEAYGLIGVFAIIQAFSSVLDSGLSTTLNRELAHASGRHRDPREVRDLTASIGLVYWSMGIVIAAVSIVCAPMIARHWVQAESLAPEVIRIALVLMGINFALQWPAALYTGGIQGLQRHVALNCVLIVAAAVRSFGALAVLAFWSATLIAFFAWQIAISAVTTAALHALLWRSLPPSAARARFSFAELRKVWRFVAGMGGLSLLTLVLTQADKLILSRMVSLQAFGYYTLAALVASVLSRLIAPLYGALFPRFSQLVGQHDTAELARVYHKGCQLASVMLLPIAVVLAGFSYEVVWVWTRDVDIAANTYLLLSLVVTGTALNGVMVLPYALQLAHRWTRLAILSNVVAVIVMVPLIMVATLRWGAVGAAGGWAVVNAGYFVVTPWFIHQRILRGECRSWYVRDVSLPLLAALVTVAVWRFALPPNPSLLLAAACVGGAVVTATATAAASVGWIRRLILVSGPRAVRQLFPLGVVPRG
jgi:O-antigen/teichoic acid export membrane protein